MPLADSIFAAAYVSSPTVEFSDHDLSMLLLSARRYNAQHGITGKLVVAEAEADDGTTRVVRFVQWIEGEAETVRRCLRRIHADPRHDEMEIQFFGPVEARRYPGWDMAISTVPEGALATATREVVPHPTPVEPNELDLA